MTRINAGYPVKQLTQKHLLAEHREIKRIPNVILSGKANMNNIPPKFTLGTGHVKFFYDKLEYLHKRYIEIRNECINRGYNVQDYEESFLSLSHSIYYNDWSPNEDDKLLIVNRINERLNANNN